MSESCVTMYITAAAIDMGLLLKRERRAKLAETKFEGKKPLKYMIIHVLGKLEKLTKAHDN